MTNGPVDKFGETVKAAADKVEDLNTKFDSIINKPGVKNFFTGITGAVSEFNTSLSGIPAKLATVGGSVIALNAQTVILEKGFVGAAQKVGIASDKLGKVGKVLQYIEEPTRRVTKAQVTAALAFNRVTNAAGLYDDRITSATFRLREFGVSGAQAAVAAQELYKTFTDLSIGGITPTEQSLIETVAILKQFGVSEQQTSKAMQELRKTFGQSDMEINDTALSLKAFATETGMTASEVITNFNKQVPTLARFGDDGTRIFKQMQAASKATGIAMSDMVSVTDKFNRFDTAAETVGRLNALLGGPYLNTIDMVRETSPEGRIRILADAFSQAGKSAESMGEYQLLAFADAMDLGSDVSKLVKIMKGDYDLLAPAIDTAAESQDELSKQLATTRTAEKNAEIIENTSLAVDALAETFLKFNKESFPIATENAKELRKEVAKVQPVIDKIGDMIKEKMITPLADAGREMGVGVAAAAASPGQPLVVQLVLDERGRRVISEMAISGVAAELTGGP